MKKVMLALVIVAAVPLCAHGAEFKIGFVNATAIFAQYSVAKDAQQAYEKEMTELNLQVESLEKEIQAYNDTLEARKYLFSEERLNEKKAELEKKQQDYLKFRQDAEMKAAKRNDELTKPIVGEIEKAAKKVAEKEGFDLVLDSAAGIVVYSKPELDLTDKVLQSLEEAKASGEAGQTGQPGQPAQTSGGQ
jgi:outer membrane protein